MNLVENTQKRLAAWKIDSLSLAGRVTLIKDVTSALPNYTMMYVKCSSETCLKLDKFNSDFLWGHTTNKNDVYLIKWDNVCLSKRNGGLGIKKTKNMNQVLLTKIGRWLLHGENGIWCKLLQYKYLKNRNIADSELTKGITCSSTWKDIAFGAKLVAKVFNGE
ncbi:hypothetical protein Dsin_031621 [Dipteronia sinensis]|uniref:Uncharacterized protein n=1 Tax=Dipteronia sinensis TaxID=43782 RepID=A0AAD9ZMS5_9ROSI|nr:hypothetical protein Dsin_031621 [Dipteronia sinensis]